MIDPLKADAVKLAQAEVETVWINVQDARGSAERVRKARDIKSPWLVDSDERPLANLLRVDSLPRAVLVDTFAGCVTTVIPGRRNSTRR